MRTHDSYILKRTLSVDGTASLKRKRGYAPYLSMPKIKVSEWIEYFTFIANQASGKKIVIMLDEISWMGSEDSDFLGQLKTAWDLHFSENPDLIFILCGSVSSWIEENILKSTGFVGRISVDMVLEELSINGFTV